MIIITDTDYQTQKHGNMGVVKKLQRINSILKGSNDLLFITQIGPSNTHLQSILLLNSQIWLPTWFIFYNSSPDRSSAKSQVYNTALVGKRSLLNLINSFYKRCSKLLWWRFPLKDVSFWKASPSPHSQKRKGSCLNSQSLSTHLSTPSQLWQLGVTEVTLLL